MCVCVCVRFKTVPCLLLVFSVILPSFRSTNATECTSEEHREKKTEIYQLKVKYERIGMEMGAGTGMGILFGGASRPASISLLPFFAVVKLEEFQVRERGTVNSV